MDSATSTKPADIDEYISNFPEDIQKTLEEVRQTIKKAAPEAEETISYAMPAFKLNGVLVYFAAFKNHIGLYPRVALAGAFKDELASYKGGKGTIQLPFDQPMPLDLIGRIVKHRVQQDIEKARAKKKKS
jgi:uncharacterized protein YdhG (YjbR/CyaY superfamily)